MHCIYDLSSVFQAMPPIIGMSCPIFKVWFRCCYYYKHVSYLHMWHFLQIVYKLVHHCFVHLKQVLKFS